MSFARESIGYVYLGINIIVILVFCVFLYMFFKLKDKNYGAFMILTLNITYILIPLMTFPQFFELDANILNILHSIKVTAYHFGIFWSTVLSIFTYLVLKSFQLFNFKKFVTQSAILCVILTLPFPLMPFFPKFGTGVLFFVISDVIGILIPVLITTYCYLKVYKAIKNPFNGRVANQTSSARILGLLLMPIFCLLPIFVNDIDNVFGAGETKYIVNMVAEILYYIWELYNLWAYGFLKVADPDIDYEELDEGKLSVGSWNTVKDSNGSNPQVM